MSHFGVMFLSTHRLSYDIYRLIGGQKSSWRQSKKSRLHLSLVRTIVRQKMRIPFLQTTFLTLFLLLSCNRAQMNFANSLIGEWEITSVEIIGETSGEIAPGTIGGILRLIDCDGATNFNPCPATFTAIDGDVYEVEWAAALDFDEADRLELDFVSAPNDFEDDIIADLLSRPWNVDLSNDDLQMDMAHVTQTGPALDFERLVEARVTLRRLKPPLRVEEVLHKAPGVHKDQKAMPSSATKGR